MGYKPGDRIHVMKINGIDVNFLATIYKVSSTMAKLINCTEKSFEESYINLPNSSSYGFDKEDYFLLATYDELVEELTEETEKQVETILDDYLNKLGLEEDKETLEHENEKLKSENKALRLQADEYFELWQNELQNKENE